MIRCNPQTLKCTTKSTCRIALKFEILSVDIPQLSITTYMYTLKRCNSVTPKVRKVSRAE